MRDDYEIIKKMEDDYDTESKKKIIVSQQDIEDVQELLKSLGAFVVHAPGEAEALCALMNRKGIVDYVAGEDSDFFPFGAVKIIRNIGTKNKRNDLMRLYSVPDILDKIGINHDQLVEICILCQNDFNKKIRINGFGFAKSLNAIKQYQTVDNFILEKRKGFLIILLFSD